MKVALVLLTYNEVDGCRNDVHQIPRDAFDQIYAIDGGSNDGTVEYLISQNIDVFKQPVKGYNQAYIYAIEKCKCEAIVIFQPKGTVPVDSILKFRGYFDKGYELIIGSRMISGASNEEDTQIIKPRKWFVEALGLISSILWKREGKLIWDVLHGFRGITVSAFQKLDVLPYGLTIDLEMVSRGYKKRLKMIEFPTTETRRIGGKTHFKALPTGKRMLKYLWFEFFRKN